MCLCQNHVYFTGTVRLCVRLDSWVIDVNQYATNDSYEMIKQNEKVNKININAVGWKTTKVYVVKAI